jgi:hypothetical protein
MAKRKKVGAKLRPSCGTMAARSSDPMGPPSYSVRVPTIVRHRGPRTGLQTTRCGRPTGLRKCATAHRRAILDAPCHPATGVAGLQSSVGSRSLLSTATADCQCTGSEAPL